MLARRKRLLPRPSREEHDTDDPLHIPNTLAHKEALKKD